MLNPDYINDYGLLNAKKADINAENAPLWSLEYILLDNSTDLLQKLTIYIDSCRTETPGLFHQLPFKTEVPGDQYMSPDQLIAFIGAFKLSNRQEAINNIWGYLKKHLFTYDNINPGKINFQRIMQPGVVLFCGLLAGNQWLRPFLSIALIIACLSSPEATSGKIKAWVMFKVADMKITEFICTFIINRNKYLKSWKGVFFEYFKEEEHPIREKF